MRTAIGCVMAIGLLGMATTARAEMQMQGVAVNGHSLNGMNMQGTAINGLSPNGMQMQGSARNGGILRIMNNQGTALNRLTLHAGPADCTGVLELDDAADACRAITDPGTEATGVTTEAVHAVSGQLFFQ